MVGTELVSKLVNQQANHIVGDAALEPIRAQPEFIEDQFAAWAVGSRTKMMRSRAEFHRNLPSQRFFGHRVCKRGNLTHSAGPFGFRNPVRENSRIWIIFAGPDFRPRCDLTSGQNRTRVSRILPRTRRHHAAVNNGVALAYG